MRMSSKAWIGTALSTKMTDGCMGINTIILNQPKFEDKYFLSVINSSLFL